MDLHKKLYGIKELAEAFGKSKQVISYWIKARNYLPEPAYRISSGPIWTYEQLEPLKLAASRYSIFYNFTL